MDFILTKAMADAVEEGIIGAVQYISPYRERMATATTSDQIGSAKASVPKSTQCTLLQAGGRLPKIMVIIPEEHIMGEWGAYAEGRAFKFDEYEGRRDGSGSGDASPGESAMSMAQRLIRPPDPAGETEIIKRFLEHGFEVVDPKLMEELRNQERFRMANDNVNIAAGIGTEFGADIVITGEAFSEFSKNINGLMSCRARVEAKAIETRTARIVATDGLHAGAVDVSEVIAGKTALRNAGGKIANYFITQICEDDKAQYNDMISSSAPGTGMTELTISNIDFMASSRIQKALSALKMVSAVEKQSFRNKTACFRVSHSGSTDEFAEAMISNTSEFPIEIVSLEGGKIVAKVK